MRLGVPLVCLVAGFAGGFAVHPMFAREARADSRASTPTIYVPADGLVFRSPDGKPIARVSRDAHGGTFELYDDGSGAFVPVLEGRATSHELQSNPYVEKGSGPYDLLDEEDPFVTSPSPVPMKPGPGF
jgi:hypothetical protein